MFAVHKPSETKTSSVENDLIIEKYSPNSSAAFWRSCFQAFVFWVMLRHSRSVQDTKRTNSSMSKANRVTASQPACTRSTASLQLEIPTWDIKLRTVLPSKQQGGMETAVQLSCSHEGFRKSGFRQSSTTISRLHSAESESVTKGMAPTQLQAPLVAAPLLSGYPLTHGPVRTGYGGLICMSTCKQKEATEARAELFAVDVPSLCLLVFGRGVSYCALFSRGLMMYYSKPLLTFWGKWDSPSLTVNDLEREAKGKLTLVALQLVRQTGCLWDCGPVLEIWCSLGLMDPHWGHPVVRMGMVPQDAGSGMLRRPGAALLFKQSS